MATIIIDFSADRTEYVYENDYQAGEALAHEWGLYTDLQPLQRVHQAKVDAFQATKEYRETTIAITHRP